jgi:putative thioredoxin
MSAPSEYVFEANLEDFEKAVLLASKQKIILVDFWAEWCAPCHGLAPHLVRAVDALAGQVLLAKVEVDEGENMKLAGKYKLRGFPTVIMFIDGEEKGRFAGARATHWISEWISEHAGDALH